MTQIQALALILLLLNRQEIKRATLLTSLAQVDLRKELLPRWQLGADINGRFRLSYRSASS
jgi:hypothetical protein